MRPRVISHMIMSLDGRLLTQRWSVSSRGYREDFVGNLYESVADRLEGDAWLVGRRTMEGFFPEREAVRSPRGIGREPSSFRGDRQGRNLAVIMDPSGRYDYDSPTLDDDHLLVVLSSSVDEPYLERLRRIGVSYTFAGPDGRDIDTALTRLSEEFSVSRVLLEGGGILNGAFLASGCIDEVSTLVFPVIDGLADVPSIYDHDDDRSQFPRALAGLKLLSHTPMEGGVMWLRYEVVNGNREGAASE